MVFAYRTEAASRSYRETANRKTPMRKAMHTATPMIMAMAHCTSRNAPMMISPTESSTPPSGEALVR